MKKKRNNKNRREFINWLLSFSLFATLISIVYPIYQYLIPPKRREANPKSVLAARIDELAPNSGTIIRFGSKPVILIHTPDNKFVAFSAICTHLECIVQYRRDLEQIWCACHNGHYDLQGRNIAGPPPRPLPPYQVNIKNSNVYVTRIT